MTTKTKPHLNGMRPPAPKVLHLTLWQRLACKHIDLMPVYTAEGEREESYRVFLAHYVCRQCGRKVRNRFRRRRVRLLVPLVLVALALLVSYWWWLL